MARSIVSISFYIFTALLMGVPQTRAQRATNLHIGMFDWDDNVLSTPAFIYLENLRPSGEWVPESLSTREFAEVQLHADYQTNWRPSTTRNWLGDFSDQDGEDTFLNQVIDATKNLEKNAGGALPLLKSHLVAGFPISIVTARSHAPRNILAAFQWFVSSGIVFSEKESGMMLFTLRNFTFPQIFSYGQYYGNYLSNKQNVYSLLSSSSYFEAVNNPIWNSVNGKCRTATCKAIAVQDIVSKQRNLNFRNIFEPPVVISFSDDDSQNVQAIIEVFRNSVIPKYPDDCFRVYNTSDPKNVIINELTPACSAVKMHEDIICSSIPRIKSW